MKKFALASCFVLSLVSTSAFAAGVNANSSWAEIERSGLVALSPKIAMNGGTHYIDVMKTCSTGQQILTAKPVQICTNYVHDRRGVECSSWADQVLSAPLFSQVLVCEGRDSTNCKIVTEKYDTFTIGVAEVLPGRAGGGYNVLFNKEFVIPSCN